MHAPDIFYIILSVSVIIIAIAIVVISIFITILVIEARRVLHAIGKTARDIRHANENFSSGVMGSIISFGTNLFRKK